MSSCHPRRDPVGPALRHWLRAAKLQFDTTFSWMARDPSWQARMATAVPLRLFLVFCHSGTRVSGTRSDALHLSVHTLLRTTTGEEMQIAKMTSGGGCLLGSLEVARRLKAQKWSWTAPDQVLKANQTFGQLEGANVRMGS